MSQPGSFSAAPAAPDPLSSPMPRWPRGFKGGKRARDLTDHEREILAGIPTDLLIVHLKSLQLEWQWLQAQ
eukprot:4399592-Alexandrium_andersonii.AAC.1